MSADLDLLIGAYLDGRADAAAVADLDRRLRQSPDLRRRFAETAATLGLIAEGLRGGLALEEDSGRPMPQTATRTLRRRGGRRRRAGRTGTGRIFAAVGAALAAVLVLAIWLHQAEPAGGARLGTEIGGIAITRGGRALTVSPGMALRAGDRIHGEGVTTLTWGPRIAVEARPGSVVVIGDDPDRRLLHVDQGGLDIAVSEGRAEDGGLVVAVGSWRVTDIGTRFQVESDPPRVAVRSGRVEIRDGGMTVTVVAGRSVVADARGRPVLVPLPPAYGGSAQPFTADALWNRILAEGVATRPLPAGALRSGDWTTSIGRVQRLVGVPGEAAVLQRDGSPLVRMPVVPPPGAIADMDFTCVLAPGGTRAWEFYHLQRLGDGTLRADRVVEVDLGGHGRSGIMAGQPACGGMILAEDLDQGIRHAVALQPSAAMMRQAGLAPWNHLALVDDQPDPTDPVGRALATALRRHGAILFSPAPEPMITTDQTIDATRRQALAQAIAVLAPRLVRVVD